MVQTPAAGLGIEWVCVDCGDPYTLASWWQTLIGGEMTVDDDGDVRLHAGVPLMFLRVPEPKVVKNRLRLDLRGVDYGAASGRAFGFGLGATPADDVHVGERWRVLRDPEGKKFCTPGRPVTSPARHRSCSGSGVATEGDGKW